METNNKNIYRSIIFITAIFMAQGSFASGNFLKPTEELRNNLTNSYDTQDIYNNTGSTEEFANSPEEKKGLTYKADNHTTVNLGYKYVSSVDEINNVTLAPLANSISSHNLLAGIKIGF